MSPAFSAIEDHLWQSTLFVAAIWLLTLALKRNRARVRHGLWLAASYKFLIPFSVLIALGGKVEWRKAPAPQQRGIAIAVEQVSEPFAGRAAEIVASSAAPSRRNPLAAILIGAWACGFVGISAAWWFRWRRIRAAVLAGSPIELGIPVRVISSRVKMEPGVFGVFRPVLLLPEDIAERLTPAQLSAVIEHELCHVRHRDNLFAAIHMFVETVFWFHPLVWWIGKRMVEERGQACDEEVVMRVGDSQAYAEGILKVCKLYLVSPLECVSGVSGASLRKRIEVIMSKPIRINLNLAKKIALAVAGIAAIIAPFIVGFINAPFVHGQSTAKFEAASIRLGCGTNDGRGGGKGAPKGGRGPAIPASSPGRLSVCLPLRDDLGGGPGGSAPMIGVIPDAYGKYANGRRNPPWEIPRIEGGPAWLRADFYNINARAPGDASEEMMRGPMMQALLEDRFQLKMHRETREGPVYELVVAKGGPKLQPFKEGSCLVNDWTKPPIPTKDLPPGQRQCDSSLIRRQPPNMVITAQGATLQQLGFLLGLALDRPVVDKTGRGGLYDITLEFGPDGTSLRPPPPPPPGRAAPEPSEPGPSIFTAVQEQLGLKLQEGRGPREVLVIDHVERPTEN